MGYRDNILDVDDTLTDPALKGLLDPSADLVDTDHLAADLVSRTLNMLPSVPPAAAAQRREAQRRRRTILLGVLGALLLAVAAFNIWGVVGNGPQLAFVFGDGRAGPSAVLLSIQLAVKPLWNTIRETQVSFLVGALLVTVASILAVWQIVHRLQSRYDPEVL